MNSNIIRESPEEELLCDIHNLDLDEYELRSDYIKAELRDFTVEELIILHKNLTHLKRLVLKEKALKVRRKV